MAEYDFELTFQLRDDESGEEYLDALAEAGCDDAVVGFGKAGILAMDFTRDAESASSAISSAISAVKTVIPHARLVEVGPDLVGLSDMGEIFGVSRQHMRQFILEHANAPLPVHSGNPRLWHLSDIAEWMVMTEVRIRGEGISDVQVDLAKTTLAVNFAKQWLSFQTLDHPEEVIDAAGRELPEKIRSYLSDDALLQIA